MALTQRDINFIESSNDIRVVIVRYVQNFGPVQESQISDWLRQEYNPSHISYILDYWLPELEGHGEIVEIDGLWHAGEEYGEVGRPRGWQPIQEVRSLIRMVILESTGTTGYKMIFLAGLPGGGKSTLLRELGIADQFTNCNIDNFFEPTLIPNMGTKNLHKLKLNFLRLHYMRKDKLAQGQELTDAEIAEYEEAARLNSLERSLFNTAIKQFKEQIGEVCGVGANFIIDGTAANAGRIIEDADKYRELGYDCAMIMVDIDPATSKERNLKRGEEGGRAIHTGIIDDQGEKMPANIPIYEEYFGDDFMMVSNRGTYEEYLEAIQTIRPQLDAFMGR